MKAFIDTHRRDVLVLILTLCAMAMFWPYHQFILLVAVVWYLGRAWFGVCRLHPLLGWFTLGFVQGLCGSGRTYRYRRW